MKIHLPPRGISRLLLGVALLSAVLSVSVLAAAAEGVPVSDGAALWGAVPIAESASEGESTAPPNSTSVGGISAEEKGEPIPVSYGLRVLAAREEMVLTALCGNEITFTAEDFSRGLNLSSLNAITIRSLPDPGEGTLFVGSMGAAVGQTVTAGSLSLMAFAAANDAEPCEATMTFSPNGSDYEITCRLCLLEELNFTPTVSLVPAVTLNPVTYRDLPLTSALSAYDPEGDEVTFEIVRYADHGQVSVTDRTTGAYTYTPHRGFVGTDSFTYVARDRWGNYSTSATVSVQVLPPAAATYADLEGVEAAAAILALSDRGLMNGTRVGNTNYFKPAEAISRVELLVTTMEAAGVSGELLSSYGDTPFADNEDIPAAMRPYVSYAAEKGYIHGKTVDGRLCFCPHESVTRAEAAVTVSNIIGYAVQDTVTAFSDRDTVPAWSADAMNSLRALGILTPPDGMANARTLMTRADTASWLWSLLRILGGG